MNIYPVSLSWLTGDSCSVITLILRLQATSLPLEFFQLISDTGDPLTDPAHPSSGVCSRGACVHPRTCVYCARVATW